MTTNILAVITFLLVTNWTSVSRTVEIRAPGTETFAYYSPPMLNQVGTISSNVLLSIVWEGQTNSLCVKSTPLGKLTRSVPEGMQGFWEFNDRYGK